MKTINTTLLLIEFLFCLTLFSGYKISFGHGGADDLISGFFCLAVITHFIWTIKIIKKRKDFRLPVVIFSVLTMFILLKASFLRGQEFPWDGDIIVNYGRPKPNFDNQITYSIATSVGQKDTVYKVNLPDPGKKYLTTLWVSDPECTGCNDCIIDSGKLIIPDTLKKFWSDPISSDVIFLDGKSPYQIEGEPYIRYQLKGQVTGIKEGRVVFYVSEWTRR